MARLPISHYRFDPEGEYVANRELIVNGKIVPPGAPFPKAEVTVRRLRQLLEWKRIKPIQLADKPIKGSAPAEVELGRDQAAKDQAEAAAAKDQAPAEPAAEDGGEPFYQAKHKGGGKYAVKDGEGRWVSDPMTKANARVEATRMNAALGAEQ